MGRVRGTINRAARVSIVRWNVKEAEGKTLVRGLTEQRAVESAFNDRGPWWNSGASHMNQAFTRRYFQKQELVSLLDRYLDYKKSVTIGTAVYGTVRTVVDSGATI
jgi:hypothetical protein